MKQSGLIHELAVKGRPGISAAQQPREIESDMCSMIFDFATTG